MRELFTLFDNSGSVGHTPDPVVVADDEDDVDDNDDDLCVLPIQ